MFMQIVFILSRDLSLDCLCDINVNTRLTVFLLLYTHAIDATTYKIHEGMTSEFHSSDHRLLKSPIFEIYSKVLDSSHHVGSFCDKSAAQ
jgi:hypothetical protein